MPNNMLMLYTLEISILPLLSDYSSQTVCPVTAKLGRHALNGLKFYFDISFMLYGVVNLGGGGGGGGERGLGGGGVAAGETL